MKNQNLCLEGYGYLHAIELRNHHWYAEICRTELFGGQSHASEALWINCDVDEALENSLSEYAKALQQGHRPIVQFKAHYQGIVALYSGLTDEDPTQIVTVKAKLVEITRCLPVGRQVKQIS